MARSRSGKTFESYESCHFNDAEPKRINDIQDAHEASRRVSVKKEQSSFGVQARSRFCPKFATYLVRGGQLPPAKQKGVFIIIIAQGAPKFGHLSLKCSFLRNYTFTVRDWGYLAKLAAA
eukprot:12802-Pelagomonas_calceolata.AAC.8